MLLAMIWVAGSLIVLGRLLIGMLATSLIARRGRELTGCEWRRPLERACRRLSVAVPVRLVSSRSTRMPFGTGVVRPVIVLPAGADDWSDERRLAVLLHELAHCLFVLAVVAEETGRACAPERYALAVVSGL